MMVLAASDMRGAKVNKTKEKHAEYEHMSCLQQTKVNMCVWAHACLHGTILAIKEGRHSKLKTMIKEGMSASRGRRGRITHCGGRTKNVSVPDAIPCAGGAQTRDTLPTQ